MIQCRPLFRKFYGSHHDLVDRYGMRATVTECVLQMSNMFVVLTIHWLCSNSSTSGAIYGAGTAFSS